MYTGSNSRCCRTVERNFTNARFQRRYAFRYSIEYCIALRQSSCSANRNDFRRFGRCPLRRERANLNDTRKGAEKTSRYVYIYICLVSMEGNITIDGEQSINRNLLKNEILKQDSVVRKEYIGDSQSGNQNLFFRS